MPNPNQNSDSILFDLFIHPNDITSKQILDLMMRSRYQNQIEIYDVTEFTRNNLPDFLKKLRPPYPVIGDRKHNKLYSSQTALNFAKSIGKFQGEQQQPPNLPQQQHSPPRHGNLVSSYASQSNADSKDLPLNQFGINVESELGYQFQATGKSNGMRKKTRIGRYGYSCDITKPYESSDNQGIDRNVNLNKTNEIFNDNDESFGSKKPSDRAQEYEANRQQSRNQFELRNDQIVKNAGKNITHLLFPDGNTENTK